MVIKRKFDYTEPTITAQAVDDSNQYLWLAFSQDVNGNCVLKKVSAFQPDQVFFSLEIAVNEITAMQISGSYIYLAYDDDSLIGARYSTSSPLTSSIDFSIPSGITEAPVDLVIDNSTLFYLIPGNVSGTNSKVVEFTLTGTFVETIDLVKSGNIVTNASSIAVDTNSNLWLVTYTSPATLVRVYETGGFWDFTITIL